MARNHCFVSSLIFLFLATLSHAYFLRDDKPIFLDRFCKRPEGSFLNPSNCNTFVTCYNGQGCSMDCPKGLMFNSKKEQCVWDYESDCIEDPNSEVPITCVEKFAQTPAPPTPQPDGNMAINFPNIILDDPVKSSEEKATKPPKMFPCEFSDSASSEEDCKDDIIAGWKQFLDWFNQNRHNAPALQIKEQKLRGKSHPLWKNFDSNSFYAFNPKLFV